MSIVGLTEAQKKFTELGYGMFVHFSTSTLAGKEWGDGRFPASEVKFDRLDMAQWAEGARRAGMKYAVFTAKHHDGFCMWPSKYTGYSSCNAPGSPDFVKMFVEAFRKAGLKTGLYYSLWDRNFPEYENDAVYAEYMRNQLAELLTGYGEITSVFFDGLWDKDHPDRQWPYDLTEKPLSGIGHGERWEWERLYETVHSLQKNCIVLNNSSSDNPGSVKYMPVDCRTAERFDFIYRDKRIRLNEKTQWEYRGNTYTLPLEICATLTPDWFYSVNHTYFFHESAETIASWYRRARKLNANLLLNVGPDIHGRMPQYHLDYLREAAELLGIGRD